MPFTRLRYHIVTATKHRRRWLTKDVEGVIYAAMRKEAERIGGRISHINGVEDHLHIIAAIPPKLAVSRFVGQIKSESAKGFKHQFPQFAQFSWQRGFGAFSLNPARMSEVIAYVQNQKAHHASKNLWEHFERFE